MINQMEMATILEEMEQLERLELEEIIKDQTRKIFTLMVQIQMNILKMDLKWLSMVIKQCISIEILQLHMIEEVELLQQRKYKIEEEKLQML